MDNITHSLIGAAVANAGLKQKLGKGTLWALLISSNITDIDIFWGFVHDGPSFSYRRMLTHAIFGMPFLVAGFAWIHKKIFPNLTYKTCFLLYLLGGSLHVFFDLANSYGVVLLYPFSRHRYDLSWLFIIDLAIWGILLAPLLLSFIRSPWTDIKILSRFALAVLTVYVTSASLLQLRSSMILKNFSASFEGVPSMIKVFPEALGIHRWRGLIKIDHTYSSYLIHGFKGTITPGPEFISEEDPSDIQRISDTKDGSLLMWFMKAPLWTRIDGGPSNGQRWGMKDLQFTSIILQRGNPFVFGFDVTPDLVTYLGRIRSEKKINENDLN